MIARTAAPEPIWRVECLGALAEELVGKVEDERLGASYTLAGFFRGDFGLG